MRLPSYFPSQTLADCFDSCNTTRCSFGASGKRSCRPRCCCTSAGTSYGHDIEWNRIRAATVSLLRFSDVLCTNYQTRRRLTIDLASLGEHSTSLQRVQVAERSNRLRRKIDTWIELQTLYIPGVSSLRDDAARSMPSDSPGYAPQDIPLLLPSEIRRRVHCDTRFQEYEWRLREGQAYDTLHSIRQDLRLRSYLYKYKDRFSRGVAQNTRSNANIQKISDRLATTAKAYRHARNALSILGSCLEKPRTWQNILKELRDEDIRGMSTGLADDTEGTRTLSWIWTTMGITGDGAEDPGMHDGTC